MRRQQLFGNLALILAAGLLAAALPTPTIAQQPGGGAGGGAGGGGFGAGGVGGILIDADGLITAAPALNRSKKLNKKKLEAAARERLSAELNSSSELRVVSLPALEAECRRLLDAGKTIPDEVVYLAGLQRIDYVFVFPDSNDLAIAGPAEGFAPNALNVMVGISSGRPTLRLDDLLVVLRAPRGPIGCSIDPVAERLAALNRYLRETPPAKSVGQARGRYPRMAKILGQQDVSIWGVAPDSHFARTLVEADYRMKRISVGAEPSGVAKVRSYLALMRDGTNSMRRWWFAPLYKPFETSDDRSTWRISGQRVQLMAQEELVDEDGNRKDANYTRVTSERFAEQFTEMYPELAERTPIFAELQNLFDLAVLAALLRLEGMPEQIGWTMNLFANPDGVSIPTDVVPKKVQSIASAKVAGRRLVIGVVGGGVTINPARTLRRIETNEAPRLAGLKQQYTRPADLPAQRWWWD